MSKKFFYDFEFIEDGSTIDPISIGIVGDEGEELYLINRDADLSRASQWVWDNVLDKLKDDNTTPRLDLISFRNAIKEFLPKKDFELWGWYADYDHVTLCQLFGMMIYLPEGWPMYTHDLKQLVDSLGNPKLPQKPKDCHNALSDARWNKQAYEWVSNNHYLQMKTLFENLGIPFKVNHREHKTGIEIEEGVGYSGFVGEFFFRPETGSFIEYGLWE